MKGTMNNTQDLLMTAACYGAIAGMRSMMAPALISRRLTDRTGRLPVALQPWLRRGLTVAATLEAGADKHPRMPARTTAVPLMGRALSGALVGWALTPRRQSALTPAVMGAVAAVASSYAFFHLRRFATGTLRLPNALAGLMEDTLALAWGRRLARAR